MILYAESSAVLAWIFEEAGSARVQDVLGGAERVVSSDLTLLECDRAFLRAAAVGDVDAVEAAQMSAMLDAAAAHWTLYPLRAEIVDRARRPFPREPVRSLDALHLAAALIARDIRPELAFLSLDQRLRENAAALGFEVVPDDF